jgi:radical SAM protein with 4Fe4S-binding SPASM domain
MNKVKQLSSLFKIFLNYQKKKITLDILPIRLWIEPTSICNLRCVMCLNEKLPPSQKGRMDFSLFKKIIDEAKNYVYDIYLHHRGESLLHPQFAEMVKYAKEAGLKAKFHTNATLLTEEKAGQILDSGLDLISFSFDGFSKEVYEKVRINAKFEKTVGNITEFLKLKRKRGQDKPYTIIEEIEFPRYSEHYSGGEKEEFSRKFRSLGLDELIFKKLYNWAGDYEVPGQEISKGAYTVCTFPWYSSVILWDGTIVPCPQDYFAKIKLGNVSQKRLSEIWNDKPYLELRKKMLHSLENLTPCNKCDRLWRKKVMGLPFQYMLSFLNDNIIGYGKLRKILGSYERNE